ncbi:hypothetical protein Emed_007491 [Eimeria media]
MGKARDNNAGKANRSLGHRRQVFVGGIFLETSAPSFLSRFFFVDAMRVFAASLLTAVAVSSLIGGGSAAAPKPLIEIDNLVAPPAQVEHVDSQHADVRDGIPRRGELRRRVFVSTLVVALSSLAVVYLVVQCTRFLSKLNSAPFGQQRLLADGGVDPSCGEGATGGAEEATDAAEEEALEFEPKPTTTAGRVALQKSFLLLTEEERKMLREDDLLGILEAVKMLQYAEDRVEVARQRLVTAEQDITRYHQDVLYPGVTPTTSDLATLGKLEEKKHVCQKRYDQERAFLSSIAYQPQQMRRAFLKYAGSQATSNPLTERVAEALAASERVLNPGKVLPDVPSSTEALALLKMSDSLKAELEDLADKVHGVRPIPPGMDYRAVRSRAEARALYAAKFYRRLAHVGMMETSTAVKSSFGILRDVLIRTPIQRPPSPTLEQGMAALSVEEREFKAQIRAVKRDETILLSTSKAASKAAAPTPAREQDWRLMHSRFADLASVFVVSSNRAVSPNIPQDVKDAYAAAVAMCQGAMENLAKKLTPFWKTKTQEMHSELVKAHTDLLRAEEKLVGVFPEVGQDESPIIGIARNCKARMVAATEWLNDIGPLAKAHSFVSKIIGKELGHLSSTIASTDGAVPRALDRHAQALASKVGEELGRAQSHLPGKLPLADGLKMQRILEDCHSDIKAIKILLVDPPKSVTFLEANLHALRKAVDLHLDPTQAGSGSTQTKRSGRLLRKGDSGGKK